MGDKSIDAVKVAVRIRPLSIEEYEKDGEICCINQADSNNNQIIAHDNIFTFDYVFNTKSCQSTIYDSCVFDLVNACIDGFNCTIFAYGQTGSGKSFTMGSNNNIDSTLGIIPRVINDIFDMIKKKEDEHSDYKIYIQYLELYGEDIKDLLDNTKSSKVTIRENIDGEVIIVGAKEESVHSKEQMMSLLNDGSKHRTTSATKMNLTSSRSHAIFTVIIKHSIYLDNVSNNIDSNVENNINDTNILNKSNAKCEIRTSKFHFVDLAGSERVKRTGAIGQQLKEGIDINKGLLALGNVISALGDENKRGKVHVPYRDSKLTRILQDSLGGNSKTLMICCVSPSILNFNESLNSLRYANRARNIENKPIINRDPTVTLIDDLKSLLKVTSMEIIKLRTDFNINSSDSMLKNEQLLQYSQYNSNNINIDYATIQQNLGKKTNHIMNATTTTTSNNISDFEIKRLNEQIKILRNNLSDLNDKNIFLQTERDYYKSKLELSDKTINYDDKVETTSTISKYLREIEELKSQLKMLSLNNNIESNLSLTTVDLEFTNNISKVLSQAQKQLQDENNRVLNYVNSPDYKESIDYADSYTEDDNFSKRNKLLSDEVMEISESIKLKEDLLNQLQQSHHQYELMKDYYEKKLTMLNEEMVVKQAERDAVFKELNSILDSKSNSNSNVEKKLKDELDKKDDELKSLQKRQQELCSLSHMQSKYIKQVTTLESEIEQMKRQKVDITKSLALEKRKHMQSLSDKMKEIDRLKKNLLKHSQEIDKIKADKDVLNNKVATILKEKSLLRKQNMELLKFGKNDSNKRVVSSAMKIANNSINRRILSEQENNTFHIITNYINNIVKIQNQAELLKKHCDSQLVLINKRNLLDNQRDELSSSSKDTSEIDIAIDNLNDQLRLRQESINTIQSQLLAQRLNGVITIQSLFDMIRNDIAVSLPESHKLIHILLELIVNASKESNMKNEELTIVKDNEMALKLNLEQANSKINNLIRSQDKELIKAMTEYEYKLNKIFDYDVHKNNNTETSTQTVLLKQQIEVLHNQLLSEQQNNNVMNIQIEECNNRIILLQKEIVDKNMHMKYLDDERKLFRDLNSEIKSKLNMMGLNSLDFNPKSEINNNNNENCESSDDSIELDGIFDDIGEEINRIGPSLYGSINSNTSKGLIFDRLTNPSNFTGSMKNVFELDIEKKRKQVQIIKKKNVKKDYKIIQDTKDDINFENIPPSDTYTEIGRSSLDSKVLNVFTRLSKPKSIDKIINITNK